MLILCYIEGWLCCTGELKLGKRLRLLDGLCYCCRYLVHCSFSTVPASVGFAWLQFFCSFYCFYLSVVSHKNINLPTWHFLDQYHAPAVPKLFCNALQLVPILVCVLPKWASLQLVVSTLSIPYPLHVQGDMVLILVIMRGTITVPWLRKPNVVHIVLPSHSQTTSGIASFDIRPTGLCHLCQH